MRRYLALLALLFAPLVAVSCSDDGGGGDVEAFCDQIVVLESMEDPTDEEAQQALQDLVDDAPSEIKGDLEVVVGVFDDLQGLDEDDPEAMGEVFALMENEEFIEASENLEAFGVDECGLEPTEDVDIDADLDADVDISTETTTE